MLLCVLLLTSCGPDLDKNDRQYRPPSAPAKIPQASETSEENPSAPDSPPAAIAEDNGPSLAETTADADTGEGTLSIKPLSAPEDGPPGADARPPRPGQVGTAYTPDGLPALRPRGVKLETLFAEKLNDPDERFARLENAVLEMRQDFDAVLPSIVRLVAVEKDMQDLVLQLDSLLQGEPPPAAASMPVAEVHPETLPPPQTAADKAQSPAPEMRPPPRAPPQGESGEPPKASAPPEDIRLPEPPPDAVKTPLPQLPAIAPPPKEAEKALPLKEVVLPPPAPAAAPAPSPQPHSGTPPAAAGSGAVQVTGVRVGESADKSRLVFDLNGPASYRYNLDNEKKILVLEIPGAGWKGQTNWTSGKAPLVASWTAVPLDNGQGTSVVVQLKHTATVVYEITLPPSEGSDAYRIVIDIRSPEVHK